MKANKNSIHANLYQFTFNSELPGNLCPYFWKLVWATIIFIPNFIIQIPSRIQNLFEGEGRDAVDHRACGTIIYLGLLFLATYIYSTYQWGKAMLDCYSYNSQFANTGIALNSIIIAVFLICLIRRIIKGMKKEHEGVEKKEKQPSVVIEFIKAKYNKYCPKIDWDETQ